jgi:DNA modification methylase
MADPVQWPADAVERRSVASLIPYAKNSRTHSPAQIDQIVASIKEWGWTIPILLDESGGVIAGHARLMAAKKLGLEEVPCMTARGWSEAQKRAYVIADNQVALNAGWDDAMLRMELRALDGFGFNLDLIAFDSLSMVKFLADLDPAKADKTAPEPPAHPITQPGDVWLLGSHRLVCGDATNAADVAKAIAGAPVLLMVTDPPYGVDYDPQWRARVGINASVSKMGVVANDDKADWRAAWALFPGDAGYVWHAGVHAAEVAESLRVANLVVRAQIIWSKDRMVMGRGDYHWQHEPCWYVVRVGKTGHWQGDRRQVTVWAIPSRDDSGHGHATQKPVECMKRPIENNSAQGDYIYDPFVGSGTTILAGEMTARRVIALELMPGYCDVCVLRWQEFTRKEATLEATGQTYAQRLAALAGEPEAVAGA